MNRANNCITRLLLPMVFLCILICTLTAMACGAPTQSNSLTQTKTPTGSIFQNKFTTTPPTITPTVSSTVMPTRFLPVAPTVPPMQFPTAPIFREDRFQVSLRVDPEAILSGDGIRKSEAIAKLGQQLSTCFGSANFHSINPQRGIVYGFSPDWRKGDHLAEEIISIVRVKVPSLANIELRPHHTIVENDPTWNGIVEIEIYFISPQGGTPRTITCDIPPESWCQGEKGGTKLIVINWASQMEKIYFQINDQSYLIETAYGNNGVVKCIQLSPGKVYPWIAVLGGHRIQNTIKLDAGIERQIVLCIDEKERVLSYSCPPIPPPPPVSGN